MLKYMLDTNIVIYVIKHKPVQVAHIFNQHAGKMCMSSITVAELYYGAEKSQFPNKNLRIVEDFLSRLDILPYTEKAAAHFGNIKSTLSKQGALISENDLHIASHARAEGLILVSNNLREFERVEGLRLENWV
ncbi:type II toxin-antitoxin system tRNA(fMet)-specific endonuclease VapC [Rodentibacter caecimuris]|uniref:type II toxin-antitoxin system tRNA(fMet)-specific endonuclease VapC n=1 Tax=Rodentibacter caecimuris TaxID=1796644 RepID=UPI0022496954|nr:type II toxin-antitoxin system VapC family toxin [Rodentibacter heylii]MCX2961012.1 type II toxin-antitoxin system VapC family toxin [Rodentibacter heylii]